MEFVMNGTLKAVLHGNSTGAGAMLVSWADPLLRVATDASEALAYLHDLSYIHRDVKPENVLMTRTFTAKLADLGETRAKDVEDTMTQVGTPVYCKCFNARAPHAMLDGGITFDIAYAALIKTGAPEITAPGTPLFDFTSQACKTQQK